MDGLGRISAAVVAVAVAVPLALAGCAGDPPRFVPGVSPTAGPTPTANAAPLSLTVTPPLNAGGLPISTEIGTTVAGGQVTGVTLTDGAGAQVPGGMRADGSAWVPNRPLKYGSRYSVQVTATDGTGATVTRNTAFTTMNKPGGERVGSGLYLFDGNTYGVAMPVVAEFNPGIPPKARAAVQRRLFVSTDPPQPGTWHWVAGGRQAYYRAPDYWRPGTKLTVRLAIEGHPMGNGRYGDMDRKATATIGRKLVIKVENATKRMSVYQDDRLIRRIPVSLGKKSTPSSSGTLVIMDKQVTTVFDTFAELGPREGYRIDIDYAQRLTWGGEFMHAASWSVGAQGRRNVSHGCVNVSPGNARWLFDLTKIGDPVTVKGTERRVEHGNGWTAWNMTWDEFVKGSALPVPANLRPTDRTPVPTLSATPKP